MYKFFFLLILLSTTAIGWADQQDQVITLKDGSQIKGQLAGIDNGVYTVKTPIIGDVHVAAHDVESIVNSNGGPVAVPQEVSSSQGGADFNARIAAAQQKLLSNPQSMALMKQMAEDPEILEAMQDPALVAAVTSHDYQALQNNPKVQELMASPKMQALIEQLKAQQQQQQTSSSQS